MHKITVFVDHDFAGHPVSRKSKTGLAAQIGNHTLKSGSTLQSLITNYIHTRYFWIQERVQDEDISIKTVLTAKNCAQMLERSQSLLQYYNNIASLQDWCSTDQGSHTPLQDDEQMMHLVRGLQTLRSGDLERRQVNRNRHFVDVDREHRDGCAS